MDGGYYKRHADGIKHCRNILDNLNGLKGNDYVGTTLEQRNAFTYMNGNFPNFSYG